MKIKEFKCKICKESFGAKLQLMRHEASKKYCKKKAASKKNTRAPKEKEVEQVQGATKKKATGKKNTGAKKAELEKVCTILLTF